MTGVQTCALPILKDGVAHYESTPGGIGKQTVNANATIKNPLTGAVTNAVGTFEYEVGEKSATISAEKMNVFYIGVTNPIAVSAAGVSSNSLRVSISGGDASKVDNNNYNVTVSRPGDVTVTVSGENGFSYSKKFRAKLIPDPVPILSCGKKSGIVGSGEISSDAGVIAKLDNFDFDARCNIQSYVLFRVARREDPQQANVSGPTNGDAQRLLRMAKPGDSYQFMEIKAKCPGDVAGRPIGGMSFVVK